MFASLLAELKHGKTFVMSFIYFGVVVIIIISISEYFPRSIFLITASK